jgi:hypothetical protein
MIADRLVNELMLVSVLVAGDGAAGFAEKLEAAGAAAETLGEAAPPSGFDLAILLADPASAGEAATAARIATMAAASDRLLFAPLPLRDGTEEDAPTALLSLNDWFELFAEHGYQPVVDFDADFIAAGAFLVDRGATAAESELQAFAERLQNPPAPAAPTPAPHEDRAGQAERDALRAEITSLQAQIAELNVASAQSAAEPAVQDTGWEALVPWVNATIADPQRNSEASLKRALPRLLDLRGDAAVPKAVQALLSESPKPRQTWFRRLLSRGGPPPAPPEPTLLADIALVRASKFFDAAWYIASTPELLAGEPIDPVFHYVLVGSARGADPGPWFNTAAYVAAHPQAAGPDDCPLVHAIRSGDSERTHEA